MPHNGIDGFPKNFALDSVIIHFREGFVPLHCLAFLKPSPNETDCV